MTITLEQIVQFSKDFEKYKEMLVGLPLPVSGPPYTTAGLVGVRGMRPIDIRPNDQEPEGYVTFTPAQIVSQYKKNLQAQLDLVKGGRDMRPISEILEEMERGDRTLQLLRRELESHMSEGGRDQFIVWRGHKPNMEPTNRVVHLTFPPGDHKARVFIYKDVEVTEVAG